MNPRNELNTFTRLVALRYRWAPGLFAAKLTGLIAGLVPDMAADAMRQVCRWLYPIDGNIPIDALPHMLRLYGLPSYDEELYHATLARLRDAMVTHSEAGGVDALIREAERATGSTGFTIAQDGGTSAFRLRHPLITAKRKYGTDIQYGRGKSYGYQAPSIHWTRNIQRTMRYFKPARERFRGFQIPDA